MFGRVCGYSEMMASSIQTPTRRILGTAQEATPCLFVRELLDCPAEVGAVRLSLRILAQRMAARVQTDGNGLIVELGGDTGVVTQALLDRGINAIRLAAATDGAVQNQATPETGDPETGEIT